MCRRFRTNRFLADRFLANPEFCTVDGKPDDEASAGIGEAIDFRGIKRRFVEVDRFGAVGD